MLSGKDKPSATKVGKLRLARGKLMLSVTPGPHSWMVSLASLLPGEYQKRLEVGAQ